MQFNRKIQTSGFQKSTVVVANYRKQLLSVTVWGGLLLGLGLCPGFSSALHAQNSGDTAKDRAAVAAARLDSIQNRVRELLKSNTDQDRLEVRKTAYQLAGSHDEKQMAYSAYFLKSLGQESSSDSLTAEIKKQFPKGFTVLNDRAQAIYQATDPAEQEAMYNQLLADIPMKKDAAGKLLDEGDNIVYDYICNSIAGNYIKNGDYEKGIAFASKIVTKFWKGEGYGGAAANLVREGQLERAKALYQQAISVSEVFYNQHPTKGPEAFAAVGYPGYLEGYAAILLKEENYKEALPILEKSFAARKEHSPGSYLTYMQALSKTGHDQKAFEVGDEALKNGAGSDELKEALKSLYVKVKGGQASDFDAYLKTAMEQLHAKYLEELPKTMLDLPATDFSIQDLDGKTVNLADYKGKTVILDFWATWCGPCKRSFPAMQMAVNKYKNNPDVAFLFIDTWEKSQDADQQVRKFITDNHYDFRVLLDRKPADPKENMVVDKYGISGIPTKFVIDPAGKIRFRLTGFGGGNDAAVQELSAMIELAQKG